VATVRENEHMNEISVKLPYWEDLNHHQGPEQLKSPGGLYMNSSFLLLSIAYANTMRSEYAAR